MKKYNYYELVFSIMCFNGEVNHTSSMCVLSYRKPTIEEAKAYAKNAIAKEITDIKIKKRKNSKFI